MESKDIPKDDVLTAINGSYGIMSRVAERLGVSWPTAKKYVDMYEETKAAMLSEVEKSLDLAEQCVINQIQMDNSQDAKWYLSKKGKHRGYGDQVDLNHSGTLAIEQPPTRVTVEVVGGYLEVD